MLHLGEVIMLQPGYAFRGSWFSTSGIPLLRGVNIVPGGTRWDDTVYIEESRLDEFRAYMLSENDIVIAMDRPIISGGLKVARLSASDLPALLLQRVGRLQMPRDVLPDYVFAYLHSDLFMTHIGATATGTQLPHISATDIEMAPFPLPPLEEQQALVDKLAWSQPGHGFPSFANIDVPALEEHLSELDRSILAKAFRGELVPQDPNDEPASVLLERIRAERAATDNGHKPRARRTARKDGKART